jgi:hypothetical protein
MSNYPIDAELLKFAKYFISRRVLKMFAIFMFQRCVSLIVLYLIYYFTRFVIDCGYVKQRQYNPSTGMYSLDVVQISR